MTLKYGSGFTVPSTGIVVVGDVDVEGTHVTETETVPTDPTAPSRTRSSLFPLAAGATAFGLCCGLPLLGSLGVAGIITGLGVGSWIAVAVASFVAMISLLRWRRERVRHARPGMTSGRPVSTVVVGSTAPQQEAGQ